MSGEPTPFQFDADLLEAFALCFVNRRDTYAVQHASGRYARVLRPIDLPTLDDHLSGRQTIAPYALDRIGRARWLCFDCDAEDGLGQLAVIQRLLDDLGLASLREASRRGGHLWLLCAEPQEGWALCAFGRAILALLECRGELLHTIELYPPASLAADKGGAVKNARPGVGCAVRAPFGVHRLSGRAYPFVDALERPCHPLRQPDALTWLVRQPRAATYQLQDARVRLRGLLAAALGGWTERATSDAKADVVAPSPRPHESQAASQRALSAAPRSDERMISVIAQVNEHLDLRDLIEATHPDVALRRAGRGAIGWCPWHDDDAPQGDGSAGTPSLYVGVASRHGWRWRCLSANCGDH